MKKSFLALLLTSFFSSADVTQDTCMHAGQSLAVGESVWILDPVLVERASLSMKEHGYSQEQINKEITRNDWVGYRLECVSTFQYVTPEPSDSVGEILQPTGVALVLNRYSRDFYAQLIEEVR